VLYWVNMLPVSGTGDFHEVNMCRSSPVSRGVTEEQEELREEFKLFR